MVFHSEKAQAEVDKNVVFDNGNDGKVNHEIQDLMKNSALTNLMLPPHKSQPESLPPVEIIGSDMLRRQPSYYPEIPPAGGTNSDKNSDEGKRPGGFENKSDRSEKNAEEIADSILKTGKFPADMQERLRDYSAMPYAGFPGDSEGLAKLVDKINDALKAAGSSYHVNLDSSQRQSAANDGANPYSSWTSNEVTLSNGGTAVDHVAVTTEPIAKPGISF